MAGRRRAGSAGSTRASRPHRRAAGTPTRYLLELRAAWFRDLAERARDALGGLGRRPRAGACAAPSSATTRSSSALAALPPTFVHGEFYPSNVLVETTPEGPVCVPVDWEMAAVGPGLVDLAALAGGWDEAERARLLGAYREGLADGRGGARPRAGPGGGPRSLPPAPRAPVDRLVARSGGRRRSTRHDWVGEAEALIEELALGMSDRVLIVNADDFGRSPGVNAGIIRAHEEGIVTSTTLMVRWPDAAAAAAYGRDARPRVGLHLDLGEWAYRDGEWRELYAVVDDRDADAVEAEVAAQLAPLRGADGPAAHAPGLPPARPPRRAGADGPARGGRAARGAGARGSPRGSPTAAPSTGRTAAASPSPTRSRSRPSSR